ncbi:hypothetical protein [Achromobacter xylosoxidans]|uniref:hypothetical protein n=1 Tax=Alcaligenes xylosoxydans xylosoxydans TaxID=85698 RepID=UPI001300CC24|nr:hypothetical protein [Achromobacter xylosoxidans]
MTPAAGQKSAKAAQIALKMALTEVDLFETRYTTREKEDGSIAIIKMCVATRSHDIQAPLRSVFVEQERRHTAAHDYGERNW